MSRAPYSLPKAEAGYAFGNLTAYDRAGLALSEQAPGRAVPARGMGETADNVATLNTRFPRDQDAYALEPPPRGEGPRLGVPEEIVPVPVPQKKGPHLDYARDDETVREDATLEKLSGLKPAFRKDGSVTAGNSSTLNDGASAILLMDAKGRALDLKPFARWVGSASAGVEPSYMGIGPVAAINKLTGRIGWKIGEVDLVEINEAFAAQALACQRELGLDCVKSQCQRRGDRARAPSGSSGCRIVVTLLHRCAVEG